MNGEVTAVHAYPDTSWRDDGPTRGVEAVLEQGAVLQFGQLPFALTGEEAPLLDPRWTDGRSKNISLRWPGGVLRGAAGDGAGHALLKGLMTRYADASEAFVERLFPHYRGALRRGNTSWRPVQVAGRSTSWRKDDTRLHIDAFPSNPMQGTRLLRVFSNLNTQGEPRRWRVGEPFEAHAKRFLPHIARPLPGSSWLLHRLHVTKRRRTEYDHLMLQLHDRAKADAAFQRSSPCLAVEFTPGTTWVVYSDQVPHAVLSGQHLLEQTFYIEVDSLCQPATSPLRTLERLLGRPLR